MLSSVLQFKGDFDMVAEQVRKGCFSLKSICKKTSLSFSPKQCLYPVWSGG